MKPIRFETRAERVVTNCVNYMRDWFDVPAPEWVYETEEGTEKIHLVSKTGYKYDESNIANFALATSLMIEQLSRKVNPSDDFISAIGYKSAVTVTQKLLEPANQRVA